MESARLNFIFDVMPDGKPAPALMTEDEAIAYLRLDKQKADPAQTLKYYRTRKKIKLTKIGNNSFYSRKSLNEFIEEMTN